MRRDEILPHRFSLLSSSLTRIKNTVPYTLSMTGRCRIAILSLLLSLLPACGLFENEHQWDYLKSESAPPLKVPGDLQQPQEDPSYSVPDTNVTGTTDIKELEKLEVPPPFDETRHAQLDISDESEKKETDDTRLNVHTARNTEGYDLLVVEADFDKTWDKVGTVVVEMGFKIEDKSRGEGVYNIYQPINKVMTEEEKFLRPRFDKGLREAYQLYLEDRDNQTRITVRNTAGKVDDSALAKHLLVQLQARLSAAADKKPEAADNTSEGTPD